MTRWHLFRIIDCNALMVKAPFTCHCYVVFHSPGCSAIRAKRRLKLTQQSLYVSSPSVNKDYGVRSLKQERSRWALAAYKQWPPRHYGRRNPLLEHRPCLSRAKEQMTGLRAIIHASFFIINPLPFARMSARPTSLPCHLCLPYESHPQGHLTKRHSPLI